MLREPARAKVNLYLHVVGRRQDGYHLLDSLAVFPAVGDVLHGAPDDALSLQVFGPFAPALAEEADNLVLRAARLLAKARGVRAGARLVLEKNLPVASGIGGGSADAAAALRLLARLWQVDIPDGLASALGADVPVCLKSRPARMTGVGDVLAEAPALPTFGMVLANPGIAVPTPAVFAARAASGAGYSAPADVPPSWPSAQAMAKDLGRASNDLQTAAAAICPAVGETLAALAAMPGNRLARMSGSGATCFALFDNSKAAADAAATLARPDRWVWGGSGICG